MRALLLFATLFLLAGCQQENKPAATEQENIRPARIITVQSTGDEILHEFAARVEALQSVDLSFQVGGPLAELPVREGEIITKGSLVAALDPTDFQLAAKEAEVQLKLAAQDLNRKRKVLKENGIAKSQVEDARSNYDLQRVRLSKAREQLQDSKIHAPFEAYVAQRFFDRHVNVKPGDPIARLLDTTRLQVVFSAPEQLLARTNPENLIRAWAEFPFAPDEEFELNYYENRGEADSLAQTYEVSFTMANPEGWNILPGMTATAKLRLQGSGTGRMLIPASAIVPAADNSLSVWVYDPDTQMVDKRLIETASPQSNGVPVARGLVSGEQIVVTGVSYLQTGMRVQPL